MRPVGRHELKDDSVGVAKKGEIFQPGRDAQDREGKCGSANTRLSDLHLQSCKRCEGYEASCGETQADELESVEMNASLQTKFGNGASGPP